MENEEGACCWLQKKTGIMFQTGLLLNPRSTKYLSNGFLKATQYEIILFFSPCSLSCICPPEGKFNPWFNWIACDVESC